MLAYLDTLIGFAVVMLGASLLITILTQMASALFSHRGANLRWGLETMFEHVPDCPELNKLANAQMVATLILTHPLISDSIFSGKLFQWLPDRMKLATAVSPDELAAILKDLAASYGAQAGKDAQSKTDFAALEAEIVKLVDARNPSANRRIKLLTGAETLADVTNTLVAPLLKDAVNSMRDEAGKLEAWFSATMDRVSTRFTTYARIWTIAFACIFAAVTGMNSVTVISDLYSHGDFRQQVVGAAPQMSDLASKVMPEDAKTVQDAVQTAMTEMYTGAVNRALKNATPAAKDIKTEEDGKAWITARVNDATQQSAALAAFSTEIAAGSKTLLEQRANDAVQVRSILTKASFDVVKVRWGTDDPPKWPDAPGMLATAALLSLGAPFWFNLLKSLTNLRPFLASKQDSDAN